MAYSKNIYFFCPRKLTYVINISVKVCCTVYDILTEIGLKTENVIIAVLNAEFFLINIANGYYLYVTVL